MSSPVPETPTSVDLTRLSVGRPVSAAHVRRWCDDLNWLRARVVATVADIRPIGRHDESNDTNIRVAYYRTPGIIALRVEVTVVGVAYGPVNLTVGASEGTNWITHNGLDGTRDLHAATEGTQVIGNTYSGLLDVSDHTDVLEVIQLTLTPVSSSTIYVAQFLVQEVALSTVDPIGDPSLEPGVNAAWPIAPVGTLHEGTSAQSDGFARVLAELDSTRYRVRRHIQWAVEELDPASAYFATYGVVCSTVTPSWGTFAALGGPLRLQTRELYPSTDNKYTVWIRYLCSPGGTLRIKSTPVGGSTTNTDVTLTASAVWAIATTTIDLPTSGTNAEVDIELEGQVDSTGKIYLATFALIENET